MLIYYEPVGFETTNAHLVINKLMELEASPSDLLKTSSELMVHEAYRLYTERTIREFVLISGNRAYVADPDRVMRSWPEDLDPANTILERLVS
jgi:hypothetical protein